MELKTRHDQSPSLDLPAETVGRRPEVVPASEDRVCTPRTGGLENLALRAANTLDHVPLWDAPDSVEAPHVDEQGKLEGLVACGHVAEFHLALVSVGNRSAATLETRQSVPASRLRNTWASLAASLVPGQRLRILHVGAGHDVQEQSYRLLLCGQGLARHASEALALAYRLRVELQVVLDIVAPNLGVRDLGSAADLSPWQWPEVATLQPSALSVVAETSVPDQGTTGHSGFATRLPLPATVAAEALSAGVEALLCCRTAAGVQVDLVPVRLKGPARQYVQALSSRLLDLPLSRLVQTGSDGNSQPMTAPAVQAVESALREWMCNPVGLQMSVKVCSPDSVAPPATLLRIVGNELWQGRPYSLVPAGGRKRRQHEDDVDLSGLLLPSQPWPPLLPDADLLRAQGLRLHHTQRLDSLPASGALLGYVPGATKDVPVRLHESAWSRHCHVLGGTGTGKTRLLQSMIGDRLKQQQSLILLEPHGDLFMAAHAECPTWRGADVVSLDFSDFEHAPSLNMLHCSGHRVDVQRTFLIHALCENFLQMYPENKEAFGPMFFAYLTNAARLVMSDTELTATLLDIPRVFSEPLFRRALVERCQDADVRAFWRGIALRAGGEASLENVAPYIVSKFVDLQQPPMRAFLGQVESTIDLRAIMDRGGVLLINLAKGQLGERQSRFLGLLLTSRILAAVLSRADLRPSQRREVHLVVDEFGSMMTPAFESMLSEGRKFGLRALLAHQHMAQLPPALMQSVLTNTGSRILMRLGAQDAEAMARWVAPEFDAESLMSLPDRSAVVRMQVPGGVTPPFLMSTLECPDPSDDAATRERFEALRSSSRALYCKPAADVDRDIARRRAASLPIPPAPADGNKVSADAASTTACE